VIDLHNQKAVNDTSQITLNLKGIMVGNGVADWKYDTIPAYVETAFWHGLYDLDTYELFYSSGCMKEFEYFEFKVFNESISPECQVAFLYFESLVMGINVYDLYGICYPNTTNDTTSPSLYEPADQIKEVLDKKKFPPKGHKKFAT